MANEKITLRKGPSTGLNTANVPIVEGQISITTDTGKVYLDTDSSTRLELCTTASSATQATQDSDGNVIKDTYVKKAGDTMTGELSMGANSINSTMTGTIAEGGNDKAIIDGGSNTSATTFLRKRIATEITEDDRIYNNVYTESIDSNGIKVNQINYRINGSPDPQVSKSTILMNSSGNAVFAGDVYIGGQAYGSDHKVATQSPVTQSANGLMISTDKKKIDESFSNGRKASTTQGAYSTAIGSNNTASANFANAIGYNNTVTAHDSSALGSNNSVTSALSVAVGYENTVSGPACFAGGRNNHVSGFADTAVGYHNGIVDGADSSWGGMSFVAGGYNTAEQEGAISIGLFHKNTSAGCTMAGRAGTVRNANTDTKTKTGDVFIIGNGTYYVPDGSSTYTYYASNALRVEYTGEIHAAVANGTFSSTGADYAEYVKEWGDGNLNNEDRVGYMVTIKNGKLEKAQASDHIIGITSGYPSIVGNADEDYVWKYERDDFNRPVLEEKNITYCVLDEERQPVKDINGVVQTETAVVQDFKINANYDKTKTYTPRKNRPEWDYVGMRGIIPCRDDGTCVAGGFCKCGGDGIATYTSERGFDTYYVIERISENVVSVEVK